MKLLGPVLAASDLNPGSDEAIRQAALHAAVSGVALVVGHALPEFLGSRPLFPHLKAQDREQAEGIREWAMTRLDRQIERVLTAGEPRPEVRFDSGSPHSTMIKMAAEVNAGLIVVGLPSAEREGGVGDMPGRIARQAQCPVLVASPTKGAAVLAATDFSDPALPAVHAGAEEAKRRGLPLSILHAVDLRIVQLNFPEVVSPMVAEQVIAALRDESRDRLVKIARDLGGDVKTILREESAARAILHAAEEIDAELIVLGTHGRSGLVRFALGSVAEDVLRRARRSTLVVRLGGEA